MEGTTSLLACRQAIVRLTGVWAMAPARSLLIMPAEAIVPVLTVCDGVEPLHRRLSAGVVSQIAPSMAMQTVIGDLGPALTRMDQVATTYLARTGGR